MWKNVKDKAWAVVTVPAPMIVNASSVSLCVDFSGSGKSPLSSA
jgi:hypothetical protein